MSTEATISQRQDAPGSQAHKEPERDVLASRLAYLTVGLPTAGTVGAIAYAFYDGLMVSDVVLFVVMYLITALGVEAGLHRYFTHRSFDAPEPVKVFLGVAGGLLGGKSSTAPRIRRYGSRSTFAATARPGHPRPRKGLVARACWLAIRCEEDRLEPTHP